MDHGTLRRVFLLAATAAVMEGVPCFAQESPPTPPSPNNNAQNQTPSAASTEFGDIVVTARRREERMQEVPIAVSAVSGDDLARKSVTQITDLARATPGLTTTAGGFGGGVPRFNIRSQVQFEQLITLDPSVGIYFADVVQARAHGTNAAFFDLASVEVLKGPQGTLFGRNTTGGAIVITPRAPTDTLGGYLDATIGNYATHIFEGAVNVPFTDTLALRVSGRIAEHNGYTYSPYAKVGFDDENSQSWRASLQWKPTANFTNTLVVNGYHSREYGPAFRLTDVLPGSTFATKAPQLLTYLADIGDQRIAGNESSAKGMYVRTIGISNTTAIDLGDVTLKNIFGYRKVDNTNGTLDFDGSPYVIYEAPESLHEYQYSDEFQVLGKSFDNRLNWILGAYYFVEKGNETQRSTITVIPQDVTRTGYVKNTSKSVFAQGTYDLGFLRGLSLTGGLRYTWDNRQFQQYGLNLLTNQCTSQLATLPTCMSPLFKADFGALTYTVSLDWKFGSNKLVYIAHRRGYRAGGFNLRADTAIQYEPFQPESVRDIEVGLKADWDIGGMKLRTNLAGYYQWYSDIQRNITFVNPANNTLATSVINAATAHVSGFEAELRWIPVPNLEISGNLTHSALRYDKFQQAVAGGGFQDLSQNRVSYAPEWTGGGSIRYTLPLAGDAGKLAVQGDVFTQSQMELADLNVPRGIAAGYAIANFRMEWNEMLGSRISVAGYVRNAFNKDYFTGGFAIAGLGPISKQYGTPRTYGLQLHVPFGN